MTVGPTKAGHWRESPGDSCWRNTQPVIHFACSCTWKSRGSFFQVCNKLPLQTLGLREESWTELELINCLTSSMSSTENWTKINFRWLVHFDMSLYYCARSWSLRDNGNVPFSGCQCEATPCEMLKRQVQKVFLRTFFSLMHSWDSQCEGKYGLICALAVKPLQKLHSGASRKLDMSITMM